MKTKLDSWKDLFESNVLNRGKEYYRNGQVASLEKIGNIYNAVVEGNDDYEVSLKLEDDSVTDLKCTCQYAFSGGHCKHEAATLFVLENPTGDYQEMVETARRSDEQIQSSIRETLEGLSKEDLVKLVSQLTQNDPEAARLFYDSKAIAKSLASSLDDMDYVDLLEYLEVEFNKSAHKISRVGRLNEEAYHNLDFDEDNAEKSKQEKIYSPDKPNLTKTEQRLDDAQEELRGLTEEIIGHVLVPGHSPEAYVFLLELMMRIDLDDVKDIKFKLKDNASNRLREAFIDYLETLGDEEVEELKKQVIEENSELFEEPEGETLFFMESVENALLSERERDELALDKIDQIVDKYTTEDHCDMDSVNERVRLMVKLGASEEKVDRYLTRFKNKEEFKRQMYKEALEGENYVEALKIMESLDGVGGVRKRDKQNVNELIKLYSRMNEDKKLITELKYIIKKYPDESKMHIKKLKKVLNKEDWEQFRDDVILPDRRYDFIKMDILEQDELYDRILKEVFYRPGDLHFYERYEEKLKEQYPEELGTWIIEQVGKKLTLAAKRQSYRSTLSTLLKVKDFPNGKKLITEAAHEWKRQYRNRTALREELDLILESLDEAED